MVCPLSNSHSMGTTKAITLLGGVGPCSRPTRCAAESSCMMATNRRSAPRLVAWATDMPRLSVDLDLVFVDHRLERAEALAHINEALRQVRDSLTVGGFTVTAHTAADMGETKIFVGWRANNQTGFDHWPMRLTSDWDSEHRVEANVERALLGPRVGSLRQRSCTPGVTPNRNGLAEGEAVSSAKKWSGWRDSNPRPPDPQSGALARLRYIPFQSCRRILSLRRTHAFW